MTKLAMDEEKMKRLIERMKGQMDISWAKEEGMLERFGVQDGHSILEVGSGPGFITDQLAQLYPSSQITSIEIEPYFAAFASSHLAPKWGERVKVLVDDIAQPQKTSIGAYDVAIVRLVLQHLSDPGKAVDQLFRLLKPGGKLIVLDVDDTVWGIIDPVFPELGFVMNQHAKEQSTEGGNRFIGRKLWRLLRSSGFERLDLQMIASHSDELGVQAFLPQTDPDEMRTMVSSGFITEAELEAVQRGVQTFLETPDAFVMLLMLAVYGEKPL
ncbi:methyltransferase domain-containing protein [Paenibacillus sp. HW567]|uniref:methyltransferase domain-containing protein n=1 Tax=Paenibacillus sp. HW567 TaxID=1034769 RepID=UPI0003780148|nr:methyltransferase domain-containing protein [Paenibacillus sp. HW567]